MIFALLGALIGGGIWYVKPSHYEAEMTVSYVHYEKKIYADMLQKLNNLLASGNYSVLAEVLEMPEEQVKEILSVGSLNIKREPLIDDLSTEKLPFYIVVQVMDPAILPDLEMGLVKYLDHTDYIQERLNFMRQKATDELVFLKRRLAIADSLSKMYILRNEGIKDDKVTTRMELLEESRAIYSRMQEVQGLLTFNVNVEVLDGFVVANKTSGKGLMHFLLFGLFLGLGIRLVLLVFK
jgi:hypothetical protein